MGLSQETDEPLSPSGRMFLRPEFDQIIHCVIGFDCEIDVEAIKLEMGKSAMVQHPRFSSLFIRDRHGRERWRKVQVDIDRHFIVHEGPIVGDSVSDNIITDEDSVNNYIADLSVSSPLDTDKPLWEYHFLKAHKCAVLRLHHSLGDGISLMSLFLACCRRYDDPSQLPTILTAGPPGERSKGLNPWKGLWKLAMAAWLTVLYVFELGMRILFLKDKKTILSGGNGVELWPRKIATAKLILEDMKVVKKSIANSTINDVLMAVISSGLSKYLKLRSPNALPEGHRITGVAFVNLRKQPGQLELSQLMKSKSKSGSWWGNKIGIVLLPFGYQVGGTTTDPLQSLRWAKAMVDKKKLSLESLFSHKFGVLFMSCFGPKVATSVIRRVINNTTFTISNVVGPQEVVTLAGHKIAYIRVNISSFSHAISMHMVSYAGKADIQILAAKDIIPDPQVLASYFESSLQEMKKAAIDQIRIRE
ncbi:wax ester synthase/diacylglycerol acyltransferase 11-like [Impatiens glandulifera]|uniref:wax ester synthase/diacylglycerol acyltransferase 11-like n=1 Tax=Impatiens glandulifera TaxID=253017 RepID=UPI001FB0EA7F|nr:wax ester synthase/diacylglycerol acyltransferase 11-like [Impatiens glandulifera]XP_047337347.1 wax ester synthase/diacylglycerol acyltransferase 11-like [Impatiens glandulifera]